MPAVEIAPLKPPRDYQALRDEHANAAGQSPSQEDQAKAPRQPEGEIQPEPEPTRPNQVRAPSPRWTDSGRMDAQETSAIHYHNWVNTNATEKQGARPDLSANILEREAALQERGKATEQLTSKDRLAADLQEAKEGGRQQDPVRNASPPDAAKQEKTGGKAALAEDLKAAKESAKEADQSRDTSRSR